MTVEKPIPFRQRDPWNKGRMTGQKRPLKPKDVWTIRVRLQLEGRKRDLAMFNLAIDSKLRGCDLVRLRVDDVLAGGKVRDRATVIQKKTGRPVQFEITEQARSAIGDWLAAFDTRRGRYLFPSRFRQQPHLLTRQYARIDGWSAPVLIVRPTARIRCGERKQLKFTGRPATYEPCSCCSATPSWRAPFAISGSRWTMRSRSRSRSSYSRERLRPWRAKPQCARVLSLCAPKGPFASQTWTGPEGNADLQCIIGRCSTDSTTPRVVLS
jgi:hypothetical protein